MEWGPPPAVEFLARSLYRHWLLLVAAGGTFVEWLFFWIFVSDSEVKLLALQNLNPLKVRFKHKVPTHKSCFRVKKQQTHQNHAISNDFLIVSIFWIATPKILISKLITKQCEQPDLSQWQSQVMNWNPMVSFVKANIIYQGYPVSHPLIIAETNSHTYIVNK